VEVMRKGGEVVPMGAGSYVRAGIDLDPMVVHPLAQLSRPHREIDVHARFLALLPDNQLLTWGRQGFARWDAESGQRLAANPLRPARARGLAVAPDGRALALAGLDDVRFWALPDFRLMRTVLLPEGAKAVAWSARGLLALAEGGEKGRAVVRLRDADSGDVRATLTAAVPEITQLVFSADGRWLAAGTRAQHFVLWDVEKGG